MCLPSALSWSLPATTRLVSAPTLRSPEHYQHWLSETAHLDRCSETQCERPEQQRGLCSKHACRLHYYETKGRKPPALHSSPA
jgi:hypothetical protein